MNQSVISIPVFNLILSFLPVLVVLSIYVRWSLGWQSLGYAVVRMVGQLAIIGYFLTFIFKQNQWSMTLGILLVMLLISAWISLYSVRKIRREYYHYSLVALALGTIPVLFLVTAFVIPISPWYKPTFIIPLAGMIFANAMNTVSLAAERFEAASQTKPLIEAKRRSLNAALIPQMNMFFAVGLVSLPGMMTGQILAGVDPLIAARYQIVVMTMVLGAGGISAATYLQLVARSLTTLDKTKPL